MSSPKIKPVSNLSAEPLHKLPVLLEAQECNTPMFGPTVPPNSPEHGPSLYGSDADIDDGHTSLGERLAAIGLGDLKPIQEEKEETSQDATKEPAQKVVKAPGKTARRHEEAAPVEKQTTLSRHSMSLRKIG
jgi:hypothetical protein